MRIVLLVAVLMGLPMQAQAQAQPVGVFYTGNDLVEHMREWEMTLAGQPEASRYSTGQYRGYVTAAADAYEVAGEVCSPDKATQGQVEAVVANYFKAHPADWQYSAIRLVRAALVEAFPCG